MRENESENKSRQKEKKNAIEGIQSNSTFTVDVSMQERNMQQLCFYFILRRKIGEKTPKYVKHMAMEFFPLLSLSFPINTRQIAFVW